MDKKNKRHLALLIGQTYAMGFDDTFQLKFFEYNEKKQLCEEKNNNLKREELCRLVAAQVVVPVNFRVQEDGKQEIIKLDLFNRPVTLQRTLSAVRLFMEKVYGTETDLAGHCIEASEYIVAILKTLGYNQAKTVEGWCLYDDPAGCSDRDYDAHTWTELDGLYLDVTADQFNPYMDEAFEEIIMSEHLPFGMMIDEPDSEDDN